MTNTYNNILWNCATSVVVGVNGILVANFTDMQGTNYPGTGNLSSDPLFRDAANRDYRLLPDSPCIGTGSNGVNMGVTFPVGGLPRVPGAFSLAGVTTTNVGLVWETDDSHRSGYRLERAVGGGAFVWLANLPAAATNFMDALAQPGVAQAYRITATNFIGDSFASDVVAVAPVAPRFLPGPDGVGIVAGSGEFHLRLEGLYDARYVIDATEDMLTWQPVQTNLVQGGVLEFREQVDTGAARRLYRARLEP
jgi:hypothetical protein